MSRIRSTDTAPELVVRRLLFRHGLRYRLHVKDLPGKPDIVFKSRRVAIFVHGCFWHCHPSNECSDSRPPKSNTDYWGPKLSRNVERDRNAISALREQGWRVMVIWDCETKDQDKLETRLLEFLVTEPKRTPSS